MRKGFAGKFAALAFAASWGAAFLSGVEIVPDTRKIEPLALATGEPAVLAAQRKLMGTAGRPDSSVPVFIGLSADDPDLPRKVRNLAGDAMPVSPRLFTARIPRDAARYISNWPHVVYIEAGKTVRPLLDYSRPAISADLVQAGTGLPPPFNTGISGSGVFVAVVDTGTCGTHPDFLTAGPGSPSRIVHTYSSPYLASEGRSPNALIDEHGHGTFVTGVAAGNGYASSAGPAHYIGMAPGSGPLPGGILVGKIGMLSASTVIVNAVDDFTIYAGNQPLAVNLSLGFMWGPHDGTSLFESAVNHLASDPPESRRLIAVSAGNEFGDGEHFQQTSLPPWGSVTMSLAVSAGSATVDIWADGGDEYTVSASVSGGTASVGSDQPPNGATHFQVFFSTSVSAAAVIRLDRTRNGGTGKIDAYTEVAEASFTSGTTNSGIIVEPGNGDNVLSVGSYSTKTSGGGVGAQGISDFSSRGPTRTGAIKPDLTAPGSVIVSARSYDASSPPGTIVPTNDNYIAASGTSAASPHVAGVAALVWQSNPALTGAQMRERIRRTVAPPTDGSTPPNNTWGYGKLNALAAVRNSVASINAPATAVPGLPIPLSSGNSSGAFGHALDSFSWTWVTRPVGSNAALSTPAAASCSFTPDLPGDYTVSLEVGQSTPAATPHGIATKTIHVNNIAVAAIAGPASNENIVPVTFAASATDPDVAQTISFHWALVSRPAGSRVTNLSPIAGTDNATLNPDVPGMYEIGVWADDGLDRSALAVASYWIGAGPPPPPPPPPPTPGPAPASGGGGGGCSVARPGGTDSRAAAGTVLFILIALGGSLALRRGAR